VALSLSFVGNAVLLTALAAAAPAIDVNIGRLAIDRAASLARRSDTERARFHARYVLPVGEAGVDRLEVVTEFRRAVLAAEEKVRMGIRLFGVRELDPILAPWRGRVSLLVHVRLHPHNTHAEVPPFEVLLTAGSDGEPVPALELRREPVYSLALDPGSASFLAGGTIEAVFDAAPLARTVGTAIVRLPPDDLARVSIDFGRLE
jgi:hypothetical protein